MQINENKINSAHSGSIGLWSDHCKDIPCSVLKLSGLIIFTNVQARAKLEACYTPLYVSVSDASRSGLWGGVDKMK